MVDRFDWNSVTIRKGMTLNELADLNTDNFLGVDRGKKVPVLATLDTSRARPALIIDGHRMEYPSAKTFDFIFANTMGATATVISEEQRAADRARRDAKRAEKRNDDRALRLSMRGDSNQKKR